MLDLPHPDPARRLSTLEQLSAGYAQLQDVDQALLEAELNLKTAPPQLKAAQATSRKPASASKAWRTTMFFGMGSSLA